MPEKRQLGSRVVHTSYIFIVIRSFLGNRFTYSYIERFFVTRSDLNKENN